MSFDNENLVFRAKDYIYKSLAYKLEYKKQGNLAWFFKGVGGSGKTLFTGSLLKAIFGQYHTIVRMEDITNKFNSAFEDKLFIIVDETDKSAKNLLRAMKQLVANPSITIERKGKDTYEAINRASLIVNTNFNSNLMEKLAIDRREVEFSTSLDKLEFNPYFAELKEQKNGSLDRVINEILLSEDTLTQFIKFLKSLPMDDKTEILVNTQIITDAARENIEDPTEVVPALANLLCNKPLTKANIEAVVAQIDIDVNDPSDLECPKNLDEIIQAFKHDRIIRDVGKLVCSVAILEKLLPKAFHRPWIPKLLKTMREERRATKIRTNYTEHRISEKTSMLLASSDPPKVIGKLKSVEDFRNLHLIGFSEREFQKYLDDAQERRASVLDKS